MTTGGRYWDDRGVRKLAGVGIRGRRAETGTCPESDNQETEEKEDDNNRDEDERDAQEIQRRAGGQGGGGGGQAGVE